LIKRRKSSTRSCSRRGEIKTVIVARKRKRRKTSRRNKCKKRLLKKRERHRPQRKRLNRKSLRKIRGIVKSQNSMQEVLSINSSIGLEIGKSRRE